MSTSEHGPSLMELARRIQEFYTRLEAIALRMETTYVTKDIYDLNNKLIDQRFQAQSEYAESLRKTSQGEIDTLRETIKELEDDKTWLVRLVIGAFILAAIGIIFAGSKAIGT